MFELFSHVWVVVGPAQPSWNIHTCMHSRSHGDDERARQSSTIKIFPPAVSAADVSLAVSSHCQARSPTTGQVLESVTQSSPGVPASVPRPSASSNSPKLDNSELASESTKYGGGEVEIYSAGGQASTSSSATAGW